MLWIHGYHNYLQRQINEVYDDAFFYALYSYQAYNGESVALLAGVELPVDQFTAVTDPYVLSLLQPQIKDEIVQVSIY